MSTHTPIRCPLCVDPNQEWEFTTRQDLDTAECHIPNCTHDHSRIYMVPACHPHAGLDAEYCKAHGTLTLLCGLCKKRIESMLIASDSRRTVQ